MTHTCSVSGCGKPVAGYSKLCANHAKTKARHGHPLQRPVRRQELKPYEKAVSEWLDERSAPDALPLLADRLDAMTAKARIYAERAAHGRPFQRHRLQAADTVVRVHREEKSREAIIRLLAIGYLRHADARRFLSDNAFQFQVARQFRMLTDASVGMSWDQRSERIKRVYRDVPARTSLALWSLIAETGLPMHGEAIGAADLRERSRRRHKPEEVVRALLGASAYSDLGSVGASQ